MRKMLSFGSETKTHVLGKIHFAARSWTCSLNGRLRERCMLNSLQDALPK